MPSLQLWKKITNIHVQISSSAYITNPLFQCPLTRAQVAEQFLPLTHLCFIFAFRLHSSAIRQNPKGCSVIEGSFQKAFRVNWGWISLHCNFKRNASLMWRNWSSWGIYYQRETKSEVICWVEQRQTTFMNEGPQSSTDSSTVVTLTHWSLGFQSILHSEMCTWFLLRTSIKYLTSNAIWLDFE